MTSGSSEVRSFYDEIGWQKKGGVPVDKALFGARAPGPVQMAAYARREANLRGLLGRTGVDLLEAGGGGNPASYLASSCRSFTAVDFSILGLRAAAERLAQTNVPYRVVAGDICALPFQDERFDAIYCANALYHIPTAVAQSVAIQELLRIVKPGGVAILVVANSRPLASPGQLLKRLIADAPILGRVARRIRRAPPLPYKPMPLSWMRNQGRPLGKVEITCYAMASMWAGRHIRERGLGSLFWVVLEGIERRWPHLAAYLGNYVVLTVRKHPRAPH